MKQTAPPLRRGWTTGSCATAAAKAAWLVLQGHEPPATVWITLPSGKNVTFSLCQYSGTPDAPCAAVIKDAGDDPDITHGAMVRCTVRAGVAGSGIVFKAGPGVGTITRPGLPLPPGEPAINPTPRAMIRTALTQANHGLTPDVEVTISIDNGQELAQRTLNGRLGIVGGLSILGTTGIVMPFSCSAWIESIHRGVDVARAEGLHHVLAATGNVSEKAGQALYGLPDVALIEMGDFAGGLLKYIRHHPVPRLSLAGGIAKMTKLGQGCLDLHSSRSRADMFALAQLAAQHGAPDGLPGLIQTCPTVAEAFLLTSNHNFPLGNLIAHKAWDVAHHTLHPAAVELDVLVFDRAGTLVGKADGPLPL
ncbi:cobalt-precorrin-5B (C(1))-methyltransferase [Acetobacter lambici]|uniref:Cobalt-precorrin-5B C(1)-methyltransferase n=1 Tax=Acetobacter lambici TaxID=1332824 RepID=A0ABT1F102_9PROT|nr:cobalt-precorrin-5B (C(1))-methyltransferase [Acetobacter lambici]MCP1242646.1 cobalt-precorrin-5B (C(1))-methyltransferase [Acetobacter lambici]MCP1258865.1 cobalt-precorrin-5B (C(1))-methyltransferase [Acetobacter lambici]NHO57173.1 cobalt-precorrin-5B (C(1))-methyltransferase [Acetobacter lambici]